MIVHKPTQQVVLKLKNPEQVESVLPDTKLVTSGGQQLLLAPHSLDTAKALNKLNIKTPSPIEYYYDWQGEFKPYNHQKKTAAFATLNDRSCFILNEIGTGKTQAALWAADYLMSIGEVEKVLVLSPLSTLERVWGDAVFRNFPDRNFVILHGEAKRRKKLLRTDVDFYIINHDGFNIIAKEAMDMFDLVIVDEAAVYRNAQSERFKKFNKWIRAQPNIKLWLMTGTPTPNEPTDAYALAKLADSPNLTVGFVAFRDMTMQKVGPYTWVPRPEAMEIVRNVLQPAIRFTRDECFDLPETVIQSRKVKLTPQQNKYFKDMFKSLVADVRKEFAGAGDVVAANHAAKVSKLVQIVCGVVYDDEGNHIELEANPRINLVKEIIEEAGEKVIVFVPLTGTLHMLRRELESKFTVAHVNGSTSSRARSIIFDNFQNAREPQVLVAHPKCMSHGLTLTTASTIIWYGPITSNETYVQANGRIERIGKNKVSNVVHIYSTELESKMYNRLGTKQKMQNLLLDMIQQDSEDNYG